MNKQEIEKAIEILKRKSTIPNDGEKFSEIENSYDVAISALTQQLTNGWIPVKEQLPSEDECYRVQATIRCKETGYISSVRMRWFFGKFKWMNGSILSSRFEVIAWMFDDTPEPYKEVSE